MRPDGRDGWRRPTTGPALLGSVKEFRNRFVNPIMNGNTADASAGDKRLSKMRMAVLHDGEIRYIGSPDDMRKAFPGDTLEQSYLGAIGVPAPPDAGH